MSSSSPSLFEASSFPESTAASSPPPSEAVSNADVEEDSREPSERPYFVEDEDFEQRFARLTRLLEKSSAYANVLQIQMDREKESSALRTALQARVSVEEPKKSRPANRGGKRKRVSDKGLKNEGSSVSHQKTETKDEQTNSSIPKFRQPELITGAQLKDYQLEGVEWMVSLDKNGVSGILADEMGLGKTLQTIAFNAYLRELRNYKPFLIVCPLSVLHNWIEEFQKFAPDIPVCMYHGTPTEREELRRTVMREPEPEVQDRTIKKDKLDGKLTAKLRYSTRRSNSEVTEKNGSARSRKRVKVGGNKNISDTEDDGAHANEIVLVEDEDVGSTTRQTEVTFPVVITTYEMIIRDRIHLGNYKWGYIVVDEGHRLKNLDCKLMKEIKKYSSAGRMILTGTPLHNNLAELWSLLNFILPDIFDDLDSFQEWFSLGKMQMHLSSERSSVLIHTLHGILKPFLLRRLKADVEGLLPPKKEYVLYAPLSIRQRELYDTIVAGGLRNYLINGKNNEIANNKEKANVDMNAPRKLRGKRKRYDVDGDDDEYFEMLENREGVKTRNEDAEEIGRDHRYKATLKQVNNMKLQNAVMQLRKVCSHPFLFDWPLDPVTQQPIMNEELINLSGKMMVLERLLGELFRRKHKVLLFSQFTTMLDIIEDWATELKEWSICRIDGSTPPLERRAQMNRFQQSGDAPDAPMLFLLSTRAGGLGINLTAADTVIFYDQDWNPQMDVQAQDRAHRIGQKKPVLIFRLVSAHTIETKIMQRATEKRKLEALVIAKGKFKMPGLAAGRSRPATMAEMAASLLRIEGEQIQVVPNTEAGKASVLSDEDLEMLLDRSDAVFADRGKGWTSGGNTDDIKGESQGKTGKRAAFAVYDAPAEQGNDALATLMGEDIEQY